MSKGSCGRPAGGSTASWVPAPLRAQGSGKQAGAGQGTEPTGATGADGTRVKGGSSSRRAFNSASHQGNRLEQGFKPGTIRSGLWLFEDAGCSLANTSLRSASVDLPYLGNQSGKGKNSEASFIIEAGKASESQNFCSRCSEALPGSEHSCVGNQVYLLMELLSVRVLGWGLRV